MCQERRNLQIFAGPSITNVQEIINGEKHFFASPERPFYSIQYHFGICIEEVLLSKYNLGIKYGLNFDKRTSSNTSFNKYIDDSYGFIGIPLQITYKPLKDRDIRFEAGASIQYLVDSKYKYMGPLKNFQVDYIVGIRLHLIKNMHIGARFLEPLYLLRDKGNVIIIDPNIPKEQRLYKTHAIQFSLIYKFEVK
ncbi:MAG: hypothetical protein HOP11_08870 [Saprospiraceae bacterium]|nr:hypothetical protein [Saprospiraceae bacterium]